MKPTTLRNISVMTATNMINVTAALMGSVRSVLRNVGTRSTNVITAINAFASFAMNGMKIVKKSMKFGDAVNVAIFAEIVLLKNFDRGNFANFVSKQAPPY